MVLLTEIPVGSNLILDVERSGVYYTFRSKLYDLKDDGILVYLPIEKIGQIKELYDRDILYIRYLQGNKILQWRITDRRIIRKDREEYVYLASTEVSENGNRRGAYRIPVKYETIIKNVGDLKGYRVETINLSQIGLSFFCRDILNNGDAFDLTLMDGVTKIPLRVKLNRMSEVNGMNVYGSVIVKSDQELRKYIIKRQLEEIRKNR